MIGQTKKEGRRNLILAGAAIALVAVIGFTWVRRDAAQGTAAIADSTAAAMAALRTQADSAKAVAVAAASEMASRGGMTPAQVAQKNAGTVVMIEVAWKLIHKPTGSQVYRRMISNRYKAKDGKEYVYVDNGRQMVPAYVRLVANGAIEPALTIDAKEGIAIGGIGAGSGFVVTSDGFIVTNRHVAAPWRDVFQQFDPRGDRGPLVDDQGNVLTDNDGLPIIVDAPMNWVPGQSKQTGQRGLRAEFEGRMDELQVAFPNNTTRIPAQVSRVSDRHDAALIKIASPQVLPKVELNDNYNTVQLGDPVVVMGYPAVSAVKIERIGQKIDALSAEAQIREVPEPTLSVGNIGKVVRSTDEMNQLSLTGDAYQLTINSTGAGNSGGPMFDSQGKVIGIYSWGRRLDAQISFAIPIRYAMELMTVTATR
jgi:S1-C subfamily serine protease